MIRQRMLSWVVKVVPQPPELPPKKIDEPKDEKPIAAPPPVEAPPPVVEKKVTFQDECKAEADKPQQEAPAAEGNSPAGGSQPGMLTWISSALPQPAVSPKLSRANSTTQEGDDVLDRSGSGEGRSSSGPEEQRASSSRAASPGCSSACSASSASCSRASGDCCEGGVRGRQGSTPTQDAGSGQVHSISIVQVRTDLVLEDVEQEKDMEAKRESKEGNSENLQPLKQEISDAQMGRCTPVMESIKKEAGEAVLAHMEGRLQQERLEAARMAEEMARKAAEEAVRQLEVEHSAKIVIETLPEPNEQLPNILEEENEDDPECLVDICPAEVTPSSTDVEPASEKRDLESPPSQQGLAPPTTTDKVTGVKTLMFNLVHLVHRAKSFTLVFSDSSTQTVRSCSWMDPPQVLLQSHVVHEDVKDSPAAPVDQSSEKNSNQKKTVIHQKKTVNQKKTVINQSVINQSVSHNLRGTVLP
ncbi:uncharacterized protein V6R79_006340 [Siganus canaliculatus]